MAGTIFLGSEIQSFKDDGTVNAGGKVYFYEPLTTTLKDTYSDSALTTANANPVVLDSAGRASIWLNGDYSTKTTDSSDVQVGSTQDYINPAVTTVTGNYNSVINGSFENDTNADGTPDNWELLSYTGATNARVIDDQVHGTSSMRFVSVGNGGGRLTSKDFFEVGKSLSLEVLFSLKSSVVDVRNIVQMLWYKADQTASTTVSTTVFDEAAANPTSWRGYRYQIAVPSDAAYAKIRLFGCDSSDVTPGTSWFDNIIVRESANSVGTDIASAAALTLVGNADYFDVTGTTTITSITSRGIGSLVKLHFDGILTLTHHATNLILPSGANITTAAGDEAEFIEYAAGNWRCINYSRASGAALTSVHNTGDYQAGVVIQTATTVDTTQRNTNSSTAVDSGIAVTLGSNLRDLNSKVLVTITGFCSASVTEDLKLWIYRDTTDITPGGLTALGIVGFSGTTTDLLNFTLQILATPAAVTDKTYRLYWARTASGIIYLNRRALDTSYTTATTITAQEIAG